MTEKLLPEFEPYIAEWTLIPGKGGTYELSINGELAFSKMAQGRFPEIDEIRKLIKERLAKQKPSFKLG